MRRQGGAALFGNVRHLFAPVTELQQLQPVRARQRGQPVGVGLKLEDGSPDICGTHRVDYEPQDAGSGLPPSC
ncbi:unnamed protein product [Gadus morhua 'NCC']